MSGLLQFYRNTIHQVTFHIGKGLIYNPLFAEINFCINDR